MRLTRPFQSLMTALPSFAMVVGVVALLGQSGCVSDNSKSQFYTYCDNTGCYQCDAQGCGRAPGVPVGSVCGKAGDCAPGCYCQNGTCAEAGFCDKDSDCASGYSCDTSRHSCQPSTGVTPPTPTACKLGADCAPGLECNNALCQPVPVLANHCVFNRECGTGGVCQDAACQKGCQADSACGTGLSCSGGRCIEVPPKGAVCVKSADCGAAQDCINGTCHLTCAKDGECQAQNANDLCVANVCRPDGRRVPECKANADCTSGQECVNAQCRTFCFASSDCALCPNSDTVCGTGYCVTPAEANPQCQLASACKGTHCIDGACSQ